MADYERLSVEGLQLFEGNPRRGAVDAIARSLERHGQYKPVVVNAGLLTGRRMEVLAGNHTLLAARSLGWTFIDAAVIDVDGETARSIVLADNKLSDLGDYDDEALFELLSSLDDDAVALTGYSAQEVAALEAAVCPPETFTDPDDVPDVPAEPVSRCGQLWVLGGHRLVVGDATDVSVLRTLCGDVLPDVVWTDPPYGVNYVGQTKDALTIQNDGAGGLSALLLGAFDSVVEVCRPGAPVYVTHADTERVVFESAMLGAGMRVRQNLIWVKNCMVMGRSDYHYRHEPILYGFTPGGQGRLGRGGQWWFGGHNQVTVFEVDRPSRSTEHPTMKPVELIDAMLGNSLPPGGVVLDPFVGSGSTLIAAHARGCRAFCVELDPVYADVVLRRYEQFTGEAPTLDGVRVSFTEGVPA